MEISEHLVEKTKAWLGREGHRFFLKNWLEHGTIAPGRTHFEEGMQVRNFLREQNETANWNDHDFDNNWMEVVERAIGGNKAAEQRAAQQGSC
jgi:hypothetical protein